MLQVVWQKTQLNQQRRATRLIRKRRKRRKVSQTISSVLELPHLFILRIDIIRITIWRMRRMSTAVPSNECGCPVVCFFRSYNNTNVYSCAEQGSSVKIMCRDISKPMCGWHDLSKINNWIPICAIILWYAETIAYLCQCINRIKIKLVLMASGTIGDFILCILWELCPKVKCFGFSQKEQERWWRGAIWQYFERNQEKACKEGW